MCRMLWAITVVLGVLADDSLGGPVLALTSTSNAALVHFWNTLTSWVLWILHCLPRLWYLLYQVSFLLLTILQFLQVPLEIIFSPWHTYSQVNSYSHDFNAENDVLRQAPSSELQIHTLSCFPVSISICERALKQHITMILLACCTLQQRTIPFTELSHPKSLLPPFSHTYHQFSFLYISLNCRPFPHLLLNPLVWPTIMSLHVLLK